MSDIFLIPLKLSKIFKPLHVCHSYPIHNRNGKPRSHLRKKNLQNRPEMQTKSPPLLFAEGEGGRA